jgi:DNA-directed RNA polymerase subunit RPC12/RpoP
MANKPIDKDNRVRCVKCSLGAFSDGSRIGGLIAVESPGRAVCVHCGQKYRIIAKAERQYDPDKFHQQNIDEVIF